MTHMSFTEIGIHTRTLLHGRGEGVVTLPVRQYALRPELKLIRERSDALTRSRLLAGVLARHEAGERFPTPEQLGPRVGFTWSLPEEQAELWQALDYDVRMPLVNAALLELQRDIDAGWSELLTVPRGWDGYKHLFQVEAWSAGAGRAITRAAQRRTGGLGVTLPLEQRPLAAGNRPGVPARPREGATAPLWELLDLSAAPEPRTVAVMRAQTAPDAVRAVRSGRYQDLGLEPLDAQLHRNWASTSARKK